MTAAHAPGEHKWATEHQGRAAGAGGSVHCGTAAADIQEHSKGLSQHCVKIVLQNQHVENVSQCINST